MNWNIEETIVFETLAGSFMYGTNVPTSDSDYRGVCIPPAHVRNDLFNGFSQADGFSGEDRTIYSLARFFKLCADANPNIIEMLFAPPSVWKVSSETWEQVLQSRYLFISKKVKFTFYGYATSQLKLIDNHRKWFIDPPEHKPTRSEYGLSDQPAIGAGSLDVIASIPFTFFADGVKDVIRRELDYRRAKNQWDNYISWREGRNAARQEMEEKSGYDTKAAMHLIRLMLEGEELLKKGTITFPLEQAGWLKEVRRGLLTYEEFLEYVQSMQSKFDKWYDESTLPHSANFDGIQRLYLRLI